MRRSFTVATEAYKEWLLSGYEDPMDASRRMTNMAGCMLAMLLRLTEKDSELEELFDQLMSERGK